MDLRDSSTGVAARLTASVVVATLALLVQPASVEAAVPPTQPAAGSAGSFSAAASATGIRSRLTVRDFLIFEDLVDAAGPTAQAALDSIGDSTAFASAPYPGDLVISAPGLVGTATGQSVPGYPLFVSSQHPSDPEKSFEGQDYSLQARSSDIASVAAGKVGSAQPVSRRGEAAASVVVQPGAVVATADTTSNLSADGVMLSRSRSVAKVVRSASGQLSMESSLEVGSLDVGGVKVGVTKDGLVVGGNTVPFGPLKPVTDAFASAGVVVSFLPVVRTENSIVSAGLEITTSRQLPNGATAAVSHVVGRAFARADAAPFATGTAPAAGAGSGSTAAVVTPPAAGGGFQQENGSAASGGPPADAPLSAPAADPPTAAAPDAPQETLGMRLQQAAAVPLPRLAFYPVLVLGAAVLVASSLGARRLTRADI